MSSGIEAALIEWSRGPEAVRRVRRTLDERAMLSLERAERAMSLELTRRLGPVYALADLYREYLSADDWARPVVADALAPLRLPRAIVPVVDAAFDRAARSARDRR
jgi:hypothetical protein